MKAIIILEHKHGSVEVISGIPDDMPAGEIVERWQKRSIHYQTHGTLPPVTWKIAESSDLLDAIIESAGMTGGR